MIKKIVKHIAAVFNPVLTQRRYYVFYIALVPTLVLFFFYHADQSKLKVGIFFKAAENDVIQLYYINDNSSWYSESQSISKAIKGGSEYQYLNLQSAGKRISEKYQA